MFNDITNRKSTTGFLMSLRNFASKPTLQRGLSAIVELLVLRCPNGRLLQSMDPSVQRMFTVLCVHLVSSNYLNIKNNIQVQPAIENNNSSQLFCQAKQLGRLCKIASDHEKFNSCNSFLTTRNILKYVKYIYYKHVK